MHTHVATEEENWNICFYGNPALWWCRQNTQTTQKTHTPQCSASLWHALSTARVSTQDVHVYVNHHFVYVYVCVCVWVFVYIRQRHREVEREKNRVCGCQIPDQMAKCQWIPHQHDCYFSQTESVHTATQHHLLIQRTSEAETSAPGGISHILPLVFDLRASRRHSQAGAYWRTIKSKHHSNDYLIVYVSLLLMRLLLPVASKCQFMHLSSF